MVHHDVRIELVVKHLQQVHIDYVSVYFERPINFRYEAGDWIDVDFADTSLNGGKTYSLSSSPTESELSISFREGISPFKRKLQTIQPGDKMYISRYGNDYGFHLRNNRSSVLIAGGIGVARFRSMLKEMVDMEARNEVHFVYLNKSDDFLFKDELNEWKRALPNIFIEYVVTKEIKSKARDSLVRSFIKGKAHNYFISGPSGMVNSTSILLEKMDIPSKEIRVDNFGMY